MCDCSDGRRVRFENESFFTKKLDTVIKSDTRVMGKTALTAGEVSFVHLDNSLADVASDTALELRVRGAATAIDLVRWRLKKNVSSA